MCVACLVVSSMFFFAYCSITETLDDLLWASVSVHIYVCVSVYLTGWSCCSAHGCKNHREHLQYCLWPLPQLGQHRDRLCPLVPVYSLHCGGCQSHRDLCKISYIKAHAHTHLISARSHLCLVAHTTASTCTCYKIKHILVFSLYWGDWQFKLSLQMDNNQVINTT